MCGRFTITKPVPDIEQRFEIELVDQPYQPSYNAAPTQQLPVITDADPHHGQFFKWGLIPFWAKESSIGNKMINARGETLLEKPAFKSLVNKRRCLVLADSFYEWKKDGKKKIPQRFVLRDNGLFAFAGLWDEWKNPDGQTVRTFTIITTDPNELVMDVHDRMPAMLRREYEKKWLNKEIDLQEALRPYPAEQMKVYTVSTMVNSPGNNTPELINEVNSL